MKRSLILLYGVASYAIFFATFLYAFGWVVGILTPTTLDGPATTSFTYALLVNLGLLTVFAVQHSLMARPAFKKAWTKIVPEPAERSTYVLFSSVAMIAMFWLWQPMGGTIWHVEDTAAKAVLYAVGVLGWFIVLLSTFLINHFDLFGLRQVWLNFRGTEYTQLKFGTPWLYRYVRHPLYVGWLLAFWGTPNMTIAHLVFAVATSAYILIAIQLEERDLTTFHGAAYEDYKKRVPMLVPFTKGKKAPALETVDATQA